MGRLPRSVFKPAIWEEGVFLHVYNHCVEGGHDNLYPFGEKEKEKFISHLGRTLTLYSIECVSVMVMSNHYHLVLYIPKDTFSSEEMVKRIVKFTNGKITPNINDAYTQRRLKMSNDISEFMKELQQYFTRWFNRTRKIKRRGTLWEQRFKCTKLAGEGTMLKCLQYIELNPVRAKMTEDPGDYSFGSYGIWEKTGKHPFEKSFKVHVLPAVKRYVDDYSVKGAKAYFEERFAGIIAADRNADKISPGAKNCRESPLVKNRFWIDSVVVAEKDRLQKEVKTIVGDERGQNWQFGTVYKDEDTKIQSMRKLAVRI